MVRQREKGTGCSPCTEGQIGLGKLELHSIKEKTEEEKAEEEGWRDRDAEGEQESF